MKKFCKINPLIINNLIPNYLIIYYIEKGDFKVE